MNMEASLCMNIATAFTDVGHMLQCQHRHIFGGHSNPHQSFFNEPKRCQVELLQVFSPQCFSVRLIQFKTANNEWQQYYVPELFQQFCEQFTHFYAHNFTSIDNANKINDEELYVLRDGDNFFRCQILPRR